MNEEARELIEALRWKVEALQIKNDALRLRLEALEMYQGMQHSANMNAQAGNGVSTGGYTSQAAAAPRAEAPVAAPEAEAETDNEENETGAEETTGKKRGRKPKVNGNEIKKMQGPLDNALHQMLQNESFNRATFRAITGILLCLYENNSATVSLLNEYIGGSRVTIVRHTGLLKRMDLLEYVGSRKKGHYELTDRGRELLNNIREQVA